MFPRRWLWRFDIIHGDVRRTADQLMNTTWTHLLIAALLTCSRRHRGPSRDVITRDWWRIDRRWRRACRRPPVGQIRCAAFVNPWTTTRLVPDRRTPCTQCWRCRLLSTEQHQLTVNRTGSVAPTFHFPFFISYTYCLQHNSTRRMAIANGTCVSFYNQPKAHFGLPWVRPWDNRGKCHMDGKRIQCWSNA